MQAKMRQTKGNDSTAIPVITSYLYLPGIYPFALERVITK